jgi:hypothetical protein
VQAGPLQVSFTTGRRNLLGRLLWAIPDAVARRPWWVGLLDLPAHRLLPGVRTRGRTQDGRRQWYGPTTCGPSSPVDATLDGHSLGALRAVRPPEMEARVVAAIEQRLAASFAVADLGRSEPVETTEDTANLLLSVSLP